MPAAKPTASLSLDLDNLWSYMKTHGDLGWETFPSYLDLVVPRILEFLRARNLTITFFVVGQDAALEKNQPALKLLAAAGHEIGNHTITHPCSKNFAFISENNRRGLEEMTLDDIEAEIVEAGRRIRDAIPEQGAMSYGYTCYQPFVGRGATRQSYVPVVAKHCVAGRGKGERPNDARYCDLWYLWSTPCERMTGAELVGLAEQAAAPQH